MVGCRKLFHDDRRHYVGHARRNVRKSILRLRGMGNHRDVNIHRVDVRNNDRTHYDQLGGYMGQRGRLDRNELQPRYNPPFIQLKA